jgi:predicted ABC-type ATPase
MRKSKTSLSRAERRQLPSEEPPPQAVILAGPNGSGKSTCAVALLSQFMRFINADMIAQEMSGIASTGADIGAGRVLLDRVDSLTEARFDFAIETTLATRTLSERVLQWRRIGYQVHLIFMYLPSADLSVYRVAARVRDGGHDVPEQTIRRRYRVGLKHFFQVYSPIVDTWRMYDNSSGDQPELVASGSNGSVARILKPDLWKNLMLEYAGE